MTIEEFNKSVQETLRPLIYPKTPEKEHPQEVNPLYRSLVEKENQDFKFYCGTLWIKFNHVGNVYSDLWVKESEIRSVGIADAKNETYEVHLGSWGSYIVKDNEWLRKLRIAFLTEEKEPTYGVGELGQEEAK